MNQAWNRRTFLTTLGLTTAATALPAVSATPVRKPVAAPSGFTAALIRRGKIPSQTAVTLYRVQGHAWSLLRSIPVANAQSIALHPTEPLAYIGRHSMETDPLPRAWLTALPLEGGPLDHQPMSLSGTFPNALALSPNARQLLVALAQGGAYNVVPLSAAGQPGPVAQRRKQTGGGPHPAQTSAFPHSALFHPGGALAYSTDHGADRLNLFEITPDSLLLRDHRMLPPGSGPTALALHPAADRLFLVNTLSGSLSCISIDPATGLARGPFTTVPAPGAEPAVALSVSGRFLYLAHTGNAQASSLSIWRVPRGSLVPRRVATIAIPDTGPIHALHMVESQMLVATENGLLVADLDANTGAPGVFRRPLIGEAVLSLALRAT